MGMHDLQRKFLIEVGKSHLQMNVVIVGTISHILWSYIFVTCLDLKIEGTAIATFLTSSIILIGCLIVTKRQTDLKEALDVHMLDPRVFN